MKRLLSFFITMLCICSSFSCTHAEESIPERYKSILEAWGATDGESLKYNVLSSVYGEEEASMQLNIRFGGTTEELIKEKKQWDMAIVSSKDVDLQKLADEGIIRTRGYSPSSSLASLQWLYPDWVKAQLPEHPYLLYEVYCYDYDEETQDITWIIAKVNNSVNDIRNPDKLGRAIIDERSVELERKTQGIARATWQNWTIEALLANPDDWDVANISLSSYDELNQLDEAGLLYDFYQDAYWETREPAWDVPKGITSNDGRLIAIPIAQQIPYDPNRTTNIYPAPYQVLIINKTSNVIDLAMQYEKHWIQSYEWYFSRMNSTEPSPGVPEKYGMFVICKEDVTW